MTNNKDSDLLKSFLIKQAQALLEEFNEFFPFAVAARFNLEVVPINTYFGKEHPTSAEVISHLEDALKASFKESRFISAAICTDVIIKHPSLNERMDALQIRYQDINYNRLDIYIPYYRGKENKINFLNEYEETGTLDLLR